MISKLFRYALACSALIPATVAGQGYVNPAGAAPTLSSPSLGSGPGSFGAFSKGNMSDMDSDIRNNERNNKRGDDSSAATRILQANSRRPLSGTVERSLNQMFPGTRAATNVSSGSLAGINAGMFLWSNGSPVGIVRQIRMAEDGTVAVVIAENANGGFYGVPPEKLALSGGALSTTMRVASTSAPAH